MSGSPTQRSLELLRGRGYRVDIVERRIARGFVTKDLFGFIDILAIKGGEVLAVQTTTSAHLAARITKMESDELAGAMADVRALGWTIHAHGWAKRKGRWQCREVDVS